MEAHFSSDVMEGLEKARMEASLKKNRLRVHVGHEVYPVLKIWENGFSMVAKNAPYLRGFVEIFDGAKHLSQCLVIHSEPEGALLNYEFKRQTIVLDNPPKDFVADKDAPVALIGR